MYIIRPVSLRLCPIYYDMMAITYHVHVFMYIVY